MYPNELSGVGVSQPRVAVHVLDSFFASRLGGNLDEPSGKLMRHGVVLTDELIALGTAGRSQAAVAWSRSAFWCPAWGSFFGGFGTQPPPAIRHSDRFSPDKSWRGIPDVG